MRDTFLVFGSPCVEEDEINEIVTCLRSGWIGSGPRVALFERHFAEYKGAKYAVAVNSCTAAMHLSLLAARIRPGDEVITTALTFCATVNAICHSGAKPVLADVDPVTMNIDPEEVKKKITGKTKALLPVHFAGRPCDMDVLCHLAEEYNLQIIEDCAHAIETEYKGKKTGTFGQFGCFSFYVTKNITTGEGGMVLAKTEEEAARVKVLALHGMSHDAWKRFSDEGYKHYQVVELGFKYNMMDIQAAMGLHQLGRLEKYWRRRKEIWETYNKAFADLPVTIPANSEPNTRHAYHLYTILLDRTKRGMSRDAFLNRMTKQNLGVGVHYLSIPEHPYYQRTFGWKPDDYPRARDIGRHTVSLPLSAKLTDGDVDDVILGVKRALET